MKWKTFKEEMPEYGKPIFVYKPTGGVFSFFNENDDIMRCTLHKKEENSDGIWYYLKGYEYQSTGLTRFKESEFMKMKWIEIPKP